VDGRWTFFVSDGYTNTRVVKFDRNGKFLTQWGMDGKGRDDEAPVLLRHGTPAEVPPESRCGSRATDWTSDTRAVNIFAPT